MKLRSVKYSEYDGTLNKWSLDETTLNDSNLIVGLNATGKSRVLAVTNALAQCISGRRPLVRGHFSFVFIDDGSVCEYDLLLEDQAVKSERYVVDGVEKLSRRPDGTGEIEAVELGQKLKFQLPIQTIAAVARQDGIQHPFLEPLHAWADTTRHFTFSGPLGRFNLFVRAPGMPATPFEERDTETTPNLFVKASKELGGKYKKAIISDLRKIKYFVNDITIDNPTSLNSPGVALSCIALQEDDLPGKTDQIGMSSGMYRVLAVLIQLNYYAFKGIRGCILIDDIGEGLDFERSTLFIQLVREKARSLGAQLIMTTNDKFVMNAVPLEEWTVLKRVSNAVHAYNYENSKDTFEEFRDIGLTNFSFFEMDFLKSDQAELAH